MRAKFCIDGKEYLAQWNDLVKLYKEAKNEINRTKVQRYLTKTSSEIKCPTSRGNNNFC